MLRNLSRLKKVFIFIGLFLMAFSAHFPLGNVSYSEYNMLTIFLLTIIGFILHAVVAAIIFYATAFKFGKSFDRYFRIFVYTVFLFCMFSFSINMREEQNRKNIESGK